VPGARRNEESLLASELDDNIMLRVGIADVWAESAVEGVADVEARRDLEVARTQVLGFGESFDCEHAKLRRAHEHERSI